MIAKKTKLVPLIAIGTLIIALTLVALSVDSTGAQTPDSQEPLNQEEVFDRAQLIAVPLVNGSCDKLTQPYLDIDPRNMEPNENFAWAEAYVDPSTNIICARASATWSGTQDGQGTMWWMASFKAFDDNGSLVAKKNCENQSYNPTLKGAPVCDFTYQMPYGFNSEKIWLYLDKRAWQQTPIVSGLYLSDNSWVFTTRPANLYLPIIHKSQPPPPLTCEGWGTKIIDTDGVVTNNLGFKEAPDWKEGQNSLLLMPGETGTETILYHGDWNGTDLSGVLDKTEVKFVRVDGSITKDISSRFGDLRGDLRASDMNNDTINWWELRTILHLRDSHGQTVVCQQKLPAIDPLAAPQIQTMLDENPGMTWEEAFATTLDQ